MQELSDTMRARFIINALNHLKERFPRRTAKMSDEDIHTLIQTGLNKAESYGISEDEYILALIEYMLVLGHDFDTGDEYPWARKIFKIRNLDGELKIGRLMEEYPLYPEMESN
jgi:hypothetical protein